MRMKRQLCWDSPAELNFLRLMECNPEVQLIREQPCIIHYRLDGKEFRHFPDCLVKTAPVQVLWEIKTRADSRRPEIQARSRLMTECLPRFGYQYGIALAEDLRLEPRLKNACLLLKFGREAMSFEAREFAQRLFEAHHHVLWQDVIENCLAPFTLQHACRMILDGELLIDIDQTLDKATVLSTVKTHQLLEITNG